MNPARFRGTAFANPASLATLVLLAFLGFAAPAAATVYVCPPCGAPCDSIHFAAAGICPQCGMKLVDASSAAAQPPADQKKVAILVFDAVEIIDFSGPYEMFGTAGCDVYTVAASHHTVTSAMGLAIQPKYSFEDAPAPDVLVIPGGGVRGASTDSATLAYIRRVTATDRQTMSVCNGAFILANTGLLDGLSATTTRGNIPRLAADYPKIKVVKDRRYVDNGHLITTAGLSAGIDGALHVIAKLFGDDAARQVAYAQEYAWKEGTTAAAARPASP